jgi:hypothetical protein
MQSLILFLQDNEYVVKRHLLFVFKCLKSQRGVKNSRIKTFKFHFEFRFYFYQLFPHHQLIDRNNISFHISFGAKLFA